MNSEDRDLITEARRMSAILRAREGDTDRLAGWLIDALADLAERVAQERGAHDVARDAEILHAEHHPGTFVPSLDSCTVHERADYEQRVREMTTRSKGGAGTDEAQREAAEGITGLYWDNL